MIEKEDGIKSTKATLLILAAALTLICVMVADSQGFDWPRWRGPDGNGISKETDWNPQALAGGPRVLWNVNVGLGYSNVAIKEGRLYTMGCIGAKNAVWCLNAETGEKIWQYSFDSGYDPQSTPTIEGDFIYTLSAAGILLCLNAQNGELRWKKELVPEYDAVKPYYGFAGSPVVEGSLLILNVNTAGMALQKETGDIVWTSDKPPKEMTFGLTKGTDYMSPVVYSCEGKRYALVSSWKGISSVDVQTGKPLWVYSWECYTGNIVPDPVILGDTIYLANEYAEPKKKQSVLLEILSGQPTVRWKSADLQSDICSPVVLDGYIYSCHGGPFTECIGVPFAERYAMLRCLDLETGQLKWEAHPGGLPLSDPVSLMAADGKLIMQTFWGILAIAEATPIEYREISRCDLRTVVKKAKRWFSPPVLSNARIYCKSWSGELICIDVSK